MPTMRERHWLTVALILTLLAILAMVTWAPAHAHDIYIGLHDKKGQLCCGAEDCFRAHWREKGEDFEFETAEKHWVHVPRDRITWLPIPGDPGPAADDADYWHYGHICYRAAGPNDNPQNVMSSDDGQEIILYCAFIPPGPT